MVNSVRLLLLLVGLQILAFVGICVGRPRRVRRIVHGYPAEIKEFPWSVAFVHFRDGEARYCGGSILDEQWLLTAAHCFIKYGNITGLDLSTEHWMVRLGTNVHWTESELWKFDLPIDPNTGQYVNDVRISEIVPFPGFDPQTKVGDIALVRLERILDFSGTPNIQPVRLPSKALMKSVGVGTRCTMSGWGCTAREAFLRRSGDGPARYQRKATMYLFYPSVCQWLYGPFMNSTSDLCAISRRQHVNLCGGDSGGPLICYGGDGRPFQAGIASGVFTKSPFWRGNPPAIFTKVSHYLEWIVDVTTQYRPNHCSKK